jgi:hypothetical protein
MKTKMFLILASGSLALQLTPAFGRIGENEAQIDHRYGKPAGKWDDYIGYRKLYHWHGFDVMVTFTDGVSQREMFNKPFLGVDPHIKKYLSKISGEGRNGVVYDDKEGVFTTKEFEEKYLAARTAAWVKTEQKPN